MIERFAALVDALGTMPPDPEHLRAFRELCDAAETEARRESDDAGIQALAERLSTLINAHNQLSDLVDDLRRPPRSGGGGTRRLG